LGRGFFEVDWDWDLGVGNEEEEEVVSAKVFFF
jgi:hypothetical protein